MGADAGRNGGTQEALSDRILRRLKNNPVIAVLVVIGTVVIAVSGFWDSLPSSLRGYVENLFGAGTPGTAIAGSTQVTLGDMYGAPGCVPMQLDRTNLILPDGGEKALTELAQGYLEQHGGIRIYGYALEPKSQAYLITLGTRRAEAVGRFLQAHGIPSQSITLSGLGHVTGAAADGPQPVGPNGLFCGAWIKPADAP